jgi:hypothetical protein
LRADVGDRPRLSQSPHFNVRSVVFAQVPRKQQRLAFGAAEFQVSEDKNDAMAS